MEELTREMEWFLTTLQQRFGLVVTADVIAIEAVELGIEEVEHFYIPDRLLDDLPPTLLCEIMVTDDDENNEWVGGIVFHEDSPEWHLQIVTKNGQLIYRNLLPLLQ
ncbi:hypothetical protein [Sporosarcina sp. FSL K6-5500]|uniref:hypothetical protein n=1 Tax=Sporosarcina sp. FSL K6-5500 TaxID=2921558 RepID=UPI0030F4C88D